MNAIEDVYLEQIKVRNRFTALVDDFFNSMVK